MPHGDGFTLEFGNPANTDQVKMRTRILHKHFVKMSRGEDIDVDEPEKLITKMNECRKYRIRNNFNYLKLCYKYKK